MLFSTCESAGILFSVQKDCCQSSSAAADVKNSVAPSLWSSSAVSRVDKCTAYFLRSLPPIHPGRKMLLPVALYYDILGPLCCVSFPTNSIEQAPIKPVLFLSQGQIVLFFCWFFFQNFLNQQLRNIDYNLSTKHWNCPNTSWNASKYGCGTILLFLSGGQFVPSCKKNQITCFFHRFVSQSGFE